MSVWFRMLPVQQVPMDVYPVLVAVRLMKFRPQRCRLIVYSVVVVDVGQVVYIRVVSISPDYPESIGPTIVVVLTVRGLIWWFVHL